MEAFEKFTTCMNWGGGANGTLTITDSEITFTPDRMSQSFLMGGPKQTIKVDIAQVDSYKKKFPFFLDIYCKNGFILRLNDFHRELIIQALGYRTSL